MEQDNWIAKFIALHGPLPEGSISTQLFSLILNSAGILGQNPQDIMKELGLNAARLRHPFAPLSADVLFRLFRMLRHTAGTEVMSSVLALGARSKSFCDIGYVSRFASGPAEGIEALIEMQPLRQNIIEAQLQRTHDGLRLTWSIAPEFGDEAAFLVEYSMVSYLNLARHLNGMGLPVARCQMRHTPLMDEKTYAQIFDCPVEFGAEYTRIDISAIGLAKTRMHGSAVLRRSFEEVFSKVPKAYAHGNKVTAMTRFYVLTQMDKSSCSLPNIADCYGISERSLRRKLVEEGCPFRSLLEQVRQDLSALYALEDRLSQTRISERLGYATLSAYSRSLKRWKNSASRQANR